MMYIYGPMYMFSIWYNTIKPDIGPISEGYELECLERIAMLEEAVGLVGQLDLDVEEGQTDG